MSVQATDGQDTSNTRLNSVIAEVGGNITSVMSGTDFGAEQFAIFTGEPMRDGAICDVDNDGTLACYPRRKRLDDLRKDLHCLE